MTRPPLDPVRGAEAARELRALGVKGILIKAAELGYITEVTCGMPKCFCPEELGGAGYFERRTHPWTDWEPTHEHFPIPKRDGGQTTLDNSVLAHRLCNKLDYFISQGLSIEKDLARIEAAREAAAAANLSQSTPAAEAVAEVFAPEPAPPVKSPASGRPRPGSRRRLPSWRHTCSRLGRLPIPPGRQSRGSRARIVSPSFAASCSARPPSRPRRRPPSRRRLDPLVWSATTELPLSPNGPKGAWRARGRIARRRDQAARPRPDDLPHLEQLRRGEPDRERDLDALESYASQLA